MPVADPASKPAPKPLAPAQNFSKLVNNTVNKGGRPSRAAMAAKMADESQAFDSIKQKWNAISHKLADEALKAARNPQKIDGRSLVALTTSAGIAYDKRWSKQTSAETEVDVPATLASAIAAKCAKAGDVSVPSQDQDSIKSDTQASVVPAIAPELLSPGG